MWFQQRLTFLLKRLSLRVQLMTFDIGAQFFVLSLICAVELTKATNGGNYTIQWNANGIIRIQ